MERSIERTQVFFNKLKEYIDYLGKPSYSKEELKKKKYLAENITRCGEEYCFWSFSP